MRILLKLLIWLLIAFFLAPFSSAFNSSWIINIFINEPEVWTEVYIVPEGKDLYIEKIYIYDDHKDDNLQLRDGVWDTMILIDWWLIELDDLDIIIKDSLQVLQSDSADRFNIIWFLVSEDETMNYYIEGSNNSWNKHIFDKKDIDFIYFREFLIFSFMIVIKFFSLLLWRRTNIF